MAPYLRLLPNEMQISYKRPCDNLRSVVATGPLRGSSAVVDGTSLEETTEDMGHFSGNRFSPR